MTIIYAAGTAPANPAGVSPQLTLEKLWAGLELKRRYGHHAFKVELVN